MTLKPAYNPMDVSSWDNSGRGKNIEYLLNASEKSIWKLALQYQDKRQDVGHAEHVTYFALKLLEYFPNANRYIVIPAAILHDIGWAAIPPEDLDLFQSSLAVSFDEFKKQEPRLRQLHQKAGAKLSKELLKQTAYSTNYIPDIVEIISQHDTRTGFLNINDGLVRDADKLWRYTLRHYQIYFKGMTEYEICKRTIANISKPGFFYSDLSGQIAKIEMEQTLRIARSRNT